MEVDCVTVNAPSGFDEVFITNPAERSANAIKFILFGKSGPFTQKLVEELAENYDESNEEGDATRSEKRYY